MLAPALVSLGPSLLLGSVGWRRGLPPHSSVAVGVYVAACPAKAAEVFTLANAVFALAGQFAAANVDVRAGWGDWFIYWTPGSVGSSAAAGTGRHGCAP